MPLLFKTIPLCVVPGSRKKGTDLNNVDQDEMLLYFTVCDYRGDFWL